MTKLSTIFLGVQGPGGATFIVLSLSLSPLSLSLERLFHILHGISSFSVVVVVVRSKKVNVCFLFITIIYVAITLYNLIIIIREI